jgi:hypothetical protein
MPGMWIANGGAFQKLKKAWVSVNGVFQPVKDVDVALDGQFRDSGVGATPIMQAFYATLGVNAHVALSRHLVGVLPRLRPRQRRGGHPVEQP